MDLLRGLVLKHRLLAGLALALALAMKLLTPAGFMPAMVDGRIVVSACPDADPMPMAMPGMAHGDSDSDWRHGGHEILCAFSGLSTPSLAATDPVLLAVAILFVMALGLRMAAPPATASASYLRPPSRGPPAAV